MNLATLEAFLEVEDRRLSELFNHEPGGEIQTMARAIKLAEEVGELESQLLASLSLQRAVKLADHDVTRLESEFADVVIVTLLLARCAGVDVWTAIEKKMDVINERYAGGGNRFAFQKAESSSSIPAREIGVTT